MFGTKMEIIMQKAEPGSWSNLNFPRDVEQSESKNEEREKLAGLKIIKSIKMVREDDDSSDSDFDLDDVELVTRGAKITEVE